MNCRWAFVGMLAMFGSWCIATHATISTPPSPTGIAFDISSNLVSISSSSSVITYTTNGDQIASFGLPFGYSGIYDLGAGTGGNVWVAIGSEAQKQDYAGHRITGASFYPNLGVALGRELAIGGTNWLLYAVNGGNVLALNLSDSSTHILMPTPVDTRGGDWILRPGGYTLDHVLLGFINSNTVRTYFADGALNQSFSIVPNLGPSVGEDISFGSNEIWVLQKTVSFSLGSVIRYPFIIPPVPTPVLSLSLSNGIAVVTWTGQVLEQSADLVQWTVVSNAPQPATFVVTNSTQFFRAIK